MEAPKVAAATGGGKHLCLSSVGVAASCIRVPAALLAAAPESAGALW